MKRLITLAIMVAFILGGFGVAQAIEFKAKGDWQIGVMGVSNPNFDSDRHDDEFQATQRVRTTFEFIANENLKGVMRVHSGDRTWGADDISREDGSFEYDQAYLDFMIPNSPVNMKVGKQPFSTPHALGSPIFDNTIWGITAASPITDEFGLTLGWLRQDATLGEDEANKNDEVDYFYASTPITMDGFDVNPYFVYGMAGSDAGDSVAHAAGTQRDIETSESSQAYWAGLNFSVNMFDPIVVKGDVIYGRQGSTDIADNKVGAETRGWFAALAAQYNMDYMTPEVFVLYETGHGKDYADDHSEKGKVMPSFNGGGGDLYGVSTFAMSGSPLRGIGRAALNEYAGISAWGASGKMAVGGKLGDMSFIDDVTHDLQLTYYQGTNHKDLRGEGYFTTKDNAWEVTFDTQYQMYENLAAILELGYLHPSLSSTNRDDGPEDDSSFKAATGLRYMF